MIWSTVVQTEYGQKILNSNPPENKRAKVKSSAARLSIADSFSIH
jgi:hypothetical protein